MDSIERDNRIKYGLSERGEKLYKRKPEEDHKMDKAKGENLRADNKEINEYDPSHDGRHEKNPANVNDQVDEKNNKEKKRETNKNK